METKLNISSASQVAQLVAQGLVGVGASKHTLISQDGKWLITVPSDAFPLPIQPGDPVLVSVTLTRVAVEEVPIPLSGPGLIMPGKAN